MKKLISIASLGLLLASGLMADTSTTVPGPTVSASPVVTPVKAKKAHTKKIRHKKVAAKSAATPVSGTAASK